MRRFTHFAGSLVVVGSALVACSSAKNSSFEDPNAPGSSGNPGGGTLGGGPEGGTGKPCAPAKGNYDIPGNNCDDDDDGKVDNPPTCDSSLAEDGDGADFAKAIGICGTAAKDGYGLVSAKFTRGYESTQSANDDQHGILPKFGKVIKPREGARLGVLSTGYAQEYNGSPGAPFGGQSLSSPTSGKDWNFTGKLPAGFPKAAKGCDQDSETHDVINVKLTLKAPANAAGIKFDFNFYSGEWPAYICSQFNDGFIAYLSAKGFNSGTPDNMSFDKSNNPVSVNNGFFDRCTPNVDIGCAPAAKAGTSVCPGGTAELEGTGYGINAKWCEIYALGGGGGGAKTSTNGGATGWLTSSAPIQGGEEFTIEFILWDTGDGILDSSVLIDNFTWAEGAVTTSTERPR